MNTGPSSFTFPAVNIAYQLNGKGNLKSYFIMLGVGLAVGVFGGAVLFWAQGLTWGLTRISGFILIQGAFALVAFLLHVAAAGCLGWLISKLVAMTGGRAKNRNANAAFYISLISGIIGFGSFLAMFFLAVEGPNTFLEYLWVIGNFIIILGASSMAKTFLEEKPWCEADNVQMLEMSVGKYPLEKEKTIMQILDSRKFKRLREVVANPDLTENYTEIAVYYCNLCRNAGFINARSHCTIESKDSNGNPKKSFAVRLIHSSSLEPSELSSILE